MVELSPTSSPKLPQWTLEELRSVAEQVLGQAEVVSESGRVRSTPDERTLRYYTTLGLLSRPAAFRGRTALYQRGHLAQVVAIKRLQASGLPLSDVQLRLVGLTQIELEVVAQLPAELPEPSKPVRAVQTIRQERPAPLKAPSVPNPRHRPGGDSAPSGSWLSLGSGVALLLPAAFEGRAENLLDILKAASSLLAELRRQGLIATE